MFIQGDVVRVRNRDYYGRRDTPFKEYVISHIACKATTLIKGGRRINYYRCSVFDLTAHGWLEQAAVRYQGNDHFGWEGGVIIPSTAKVIRHVRYEHIDIYLNIGATTGARKVEWLSENPPPIPQSLIDSHKKYGNRLFLEEEWVALKQGRLLSKREVKRLHSQLRVA